MKWNVVQFCRDYRLPYNITRKWVQMRCPWCDDAGLHGGFSIGGAKSGCLKCGDHKIIQTVARLLLCGYKEAQEMCDKLNRIADKYHEDR